MNEVLKGILTLIIFFLVQSLILALFAGIIWDLLLENKFQIQLGYFHWFGIIFIVNLLRFDLIEKINNSNKLFDSLQKNLKKENKK